MATVRTTTPRSDAKRKRKRSKAAPEASPAVDLQLQTLENWHRALTIDMREMRREGMRVRRELEKVDDVAETAVEKAEQAENCATQAAKAQETANSRAQELKKKLQALDERVDDDVAKALKKLLLLDKKLERQKQESINEEALMGHLSALQEHFTEELGKVKTLHAQEMKRQKDNLVKLQEENAKLSQKLKELPTRQEILQLQQQIKQLPGRQEMEEIQRKVAQIPSRQELDGMQQKTAQQEISSMHQKLAHVPTRQEVGGLQEEVRTMERESREEQARTRAELNVFQDRMYEMERRIGETQSRPVAPPMTPPMPPRDLVRHDELRVIHDQLQRINRDLSVVGVDFSSLAKRVDARTTQQDEKLEGRLQELSGQLFEALSHDSRLHAAEIRRVKDAIFDIQSDTRESSQRVRRLEDDLHGRGPRERPRSPRSPPRDRRDAPRWHNGADHPPPPPPPGPRHSFDRPSRYEEAPAFRRNAPPPPPEDCIRWAPRRRSRSRSPPRRNGWGANNYRPRGDNAPVRNDRHPNENRRDSRVDNAVVASSGAGSPRSESARVSSSEQSSRTTSSDGDNEGQTPTPFRRNRQPRRTPEVIVIEEDDDEEETSAVPDRAPPDVVMDEDEAAQQNDVVMEQPADNTETTAHTESADLLEREVDLHTGFLLYFCLGGAPDLDGQWAKCFSRLKADECAPMPRTRSFQRRYSFLQSFPVQLTQCMLQAVIVNGQSVPDEGVVEASPATGVLDVGAVRNKFFDVVEDIHLSWAKDLVHQLAKDLANCDPVALEELKLAINPAGLSAEGDKDEIIWVWREAQAAAIWTLAREVHYGTLLPPLEGISEGASPAVYLFALMFEVLTVTSECPQFGSFRLNAFGGKLLSQLWNQTLKRLPYVFFADWSWLEDQSAKGKMPAVGFCHLLASILLWNSSIDRYSLMNRSLYADVVNQLLAKLHAGGKPVRGSSETEEVVLHLSECESTHIELLDLDGNFASTLGLDGFFEIWEAIQKNMLAVPEAAPTS